MSMQLFSIITSSSMNEIRPGLWIGSLQALRVYDTVHDHDHRRILNWAIASLIDSDTMLQLAKDMITTKQEERHCQIQHICWKLKDKSDSLFVCERLESVLGQIDEALKQSDPGGACVLVHCAQGKSRSAAVCAAWLISRLGLNLREALDQIRSSRKQIQPNLGFVAGLRAIEQSNGNIHQAILRMNHRKKQGK